MDFIDQSATDLVRLRAIDMVLVLLSVTRWHCIEAVERIELVFGIEAILALSYIVLKGIRVSPKTRVLSFKTLSHTPKLTDFYACTAWHVSHRKGYQLCSVVASLSHSAFTFVYNTLVVTQSVMRFVCDSQDL